MNKKSNDNKKIILETDWLASNTIFYNKRNKLFSKNINEVTKNSDLKFHSDGIHNFIDYGYSVFCQTPIQDVKFLPPSSRIYRDNNNNLVIEKVDDHLEKWWDYKLSENDIIDLIKERVQKWESSLPANQEIVLPLSGGFDSRLLLWCIKDKSRIRAYTYGISNNQSKSYEVVHAKALSKIFNIRWKQVNLTKIHTYFQNWNDEFGISTHAHGMYHFEFYDKILKDLSGKNAFLSGLVGDIWAGTVMYQSIENSRDVLNLGFTHGMNADSSFLKLKKKNKLKENFFLENKKELKDYRFQVITTIRLKLILLSYLLKVPRLFKLDSWTPFLDIDIAMSMLNLPSKRRNNRQWQKDFFKKIGLDLENRNLKSQRVNNLNFQSMKSHPIKPLNSKLLSNLFEEDYIQWINKNAKTTKSGEMMQRFLSIPKVSGLLRLMGAKNINLKAYYAYLCLKPIETILKNKN